MQETELLGTQQTNQPRNSVVWCIPFWSVLWKCNISNLNIRVVSNRANQLTQEPCGILWLPLSLYSRKCNSSNLNITPIGTQLLNFPRNPVVRCLPLWLDSRKCNIKNMWYQPCGIEWLPFSLHSRKCNSSNLNINSCLQTIKISWLMFS